MSKYRVATNKLTGRRHVLVNDSKMPMKDRKRVYFNVVGWKQRGSNIQLIYDKEATFLTEHLEISEPQELTPSLVKALQEEYFATLKDEGKRVVYTTTHRARNQKYVIREA